MFDSWLPTPNYPLLYLTDVKNTSNNNSNNSNKPDFRPKLSIVDPCSLFIFFFRILWDNKKRTTMETIGKDPLLRTLRALLKRHLGSLFNSKCQSQLDLATSWTLAHTWTLRTFEGTS